MTPPSAERDSDRRMRVLAIGCALFAFAGLAVLTYDGWARGAAMRFEVSGALAFVVVGAVLFGARIRATGVALLGGTALLALVVVAEFRAFPPEVVPFALFGVPAQRLTGALFLVAIALTEIVLFAVAPRWVAILSTVLLLPGAIFLALNLGRPFAVSLDGPGFLATLPPPIKPVAASLVFVLPAIWLGLAISFAIKGRFSAAAALVILATGPPTLVIFAYGFRWSGGVQTKPSATIADGGGRAEGLTMRIYEGRTYGGLRTTRIDRRVFVDGAASLRDPDLPSGEFWIEWLGDLRVPVAERGPATLAVECTGRAIVQIDGKKIIGGCDGTGARGTVHLKDEHDIRVVYISPALGAARMRLVWRRKDTEPLLPVPARWLAARRGERQPTDAAQLGLDWLSQAAVAWQSDKKCFGCHVQAKAILGMSVGRRMGYRVDGAAFETLAGGIRAEKALSTGSGGPRAGYYSFAALALDEAGRSSGETAAASRKALLDAARGLKARVRPDGSFEMFSEPPIQESDEKATTYAVRGLLGAYEASGDAAWLDVAEKAQRYLATRKGATTTIRNMQLIGLAGATDEAAHDARRATVAAVWAAQRADGGWSETDALPSNSFATGQTLYALKQARVRTDDPRFLRGIKWLMDRQEIDGNWRIESRVDSQSGRPSNFAASMWAAIGLAGAFGPLEVLIDVPVDGAVVARREEVRASVVNRSGSPIEVVVLSAGGVEIGRCVEAACVVTWDVRAEPGESVAIEVTARTRAGIVAHDRIRVKLAPRPIDPRLAVKFVQPPANAVVAGRVEIAARVDAVGARLSRVRFFVRERELGVWGGGAGAGADADAGAEADAGVGAGASGVRERVTMADAGSDAGAVFLVPWDTTRDEAGPAALSVEAENRLGAVARDVRPVRIAAGTLQVTSPDDRFPPAVEILLDMSGSMRERISDGNRKRRKVEIARDVLRDFVRSVPDGRRIGLRVYGHDSPVRDRNCRDSRLLFPLDAPLDRSRREYLSNLLNNLHPSGWTPIAFALRAAQSDIPIQKGRRAGVIVLVSDGDETCGGDPCAAARALAHETGGDVRVHVVGFRLARKEKARGALRCIADATNGVLMHADDGTALDAAIRSAVRVPYRVVSRDGNRTMGAGFVNGPAISVPPGDWRVVTSTVPPVTQDVRLARDRPTRLELRLP
ncbi:MAG: VWA domain-containing protein [Deltaproteobacteria bacterium]|nr:VWA domain-containing protein [Deltaproteobacteria bacterium]